MAKTFWGCTITGTDFHILYDLDEFKYFNIKWNLSGKLKIEAFGLYDSLGRLDTTKTNSYDLEQRFEGQLNLYKVQINETIKDNRVNLISISPKKFGNYSLVSLEITFDFNSGVTSETVALNPSPPAPPSDSFG